MTTQTEAERLADALEHWAKDYATTDFDCEMGEQAAAELRRLVSFNQQLMDEVARLKALAEQPAPVQQEPAQPAMRTPTYNLHGVNLSDWRNT